jgi:hypothetical protein
MLAAVCPRRRGWVRRRHAPAVCSLMILGLVIARAVNIFK